jgi:beta-aspartyl-dipeptidase (metallo-type)
MRDAIALVRQGCYVDIDVQEEDLARWLAFYVEHDGDLTRLTISSDASNKGPETLFQQLRRCARGHRLPLAKLLALVTRNTADVLKLPQKGRLEVGRDADLLVIAKDEFDLVHVLARGKRMVTDGSLVVREKFLEESNRRISLVGQASASSDGIAADHTR